MRTMRWTAAGAAMLLMCGPARLGAQDGAGDKDKARDAEIETLKKRLDLLEGKTKAVPEPGGKESPVGAYFKDGLRFRTADGDFEAHIGGRIMEHARFVLNRLDAGGPQLPNTFTFKENYIQLDGTFFKEYEYKVQANFIPNTTNAGPFASLSDCYMGWKPAKEFGIRFGQMEVPISQEEIESTLFIDFVERSAMNRLSPVRDLGMEVYGAVSDGLFEYEAGVFNGFQSGSNTRNLNDNNDEKDLAARLRVTPFKAGDDSWLKQLRLGVAGTAGTETANPASSTLPALSSVETGTTWGSPTAGVFNDGDRRRIGLELSWIVKAFGLRAEYIRESLDVGLNAQPTTSVDIDGYYIAATVILTGEDKPLEARIVPAHPFNLSKGDWGAFEAAARLSAVDAGDLGDKGLLDPAKGGNDTITATTLGVNWWPTRNVRYSLDWVHNAFDKPLVAGVNRIGSENAILMRFQLDF